MSPSAAKRLAKVLDRHRPPVEPRTLDVSTEEYIRRHLFIRTKDRCVIRLAPNPMQSAILADPSHRRMILKYRQGGASTITLARYFADTVLHPNTNTMIVSHNLDSATYLFGIMRLFYERLPAEEKERINGPGVLTPKIGNRREYFFAGINSWIFVGTAEAGRVGHSRTLNNIHASEFAFWPDAVETLSGLLPTLAPDGDVTIETTPNGAGGYFYSLWRSSVEGGTEWAHLFFPWHRFGEYQEPLDARETLTLTPEEDALGLTPQQAKWRRMKMSDAESARIFAQEYPEDDETCFLMSGSPVFDPTAMRDLLRAVKPGKRDGDLEIWEAPEPSTEYVIGADTAEGIEGGDYDAACVIRRDDARQVAELHGTWETHIYGQKLAELGKRYNVATIAVERNNHGHSVLNTLIHQEHYPNLYHHQDYDEKGHKDRLRPGWPTDSKTKPVMVDGLAQAVFERVSGIRSEALVREMIAYVRDAKGRMNAQPGAHDDRVIARSIAGQVRLLKVGRSMLIHAQEAGARTTTAQKVSETTQAFAGNIPVQVSAQQVLPMPAGPRARPAKKHVCPECGVEMNVHNSMGAWFCREHGWAAPKKR